MRKNLATADSGYDPAQALDQIPTPAMVVDRDLRVTFLNAAGRNLVGMSQDEVMGQRCCDLFHSAHCNTDECRMAQAIASGKRLTARNVASIGGRKIPIEYTAAPLTDGDGGIVGGLEFVLDITERVRDEERLREQSRTIMEISTPAIKLWEGVVILPVVGVIDSARAQQMMESILNKISETSAKVIILDIQGVAAVDTAVANHLIKITRATRLMGCECIISGISSAVSQTIVHLGITLDGINTTSTLMDALQDAFRILGVTVKRKK